MPNGFDLLDIDGNVAYLPKGEPEALVDLAAEQKEIKTFHNSFKVGAPGGGGLFW